MINIQSPQAVIDKIKAIDKRFLILWFMVSVYPLVVVPHSFYVRFNGDYAHPGFFYGPRWVILAVVSLIALFILLRDREPVNQPVFIPLIFFIVFSIISAFLAPAPVTAWIGTPYRFTGLSTYYFCIILFILAKSSKKADLLISCLVITAGVVSFLAILQYFGLNLVPHEPSRDLLISYGTLPHPNFFGTYTAFILPAAILFYFRTRQLLWLVYSCLIYSGLLVSLCRGTWIASFVGFLIISYKAFKNPSQRKYLVFLVLIFLLVTIALLPVRDFALLNRFFSVTGEIGSGIKLGADAGSYRMFIWQESFKLLKHYWAFGIGPDHLIFANIITPAKELADKAHNIYLEMAVTMGIFSLISYFSFLSFFLRKWKTEMQFLLSTMILVYLIQGFFNIDVVINMPLFWITLGLSLGYSQESEQITINNPSAPEQS